MAKRNGRMISADVCQTDAFRFLSAGAKSLYFQMILSADDDGVVDSALGLVRADGDTQDDLAALTGAGYVLRFPTGQFLITHWQLQNLIPKDRYKPSLYSSLLDKVRVEDGVYVLCAGDGLDTRSASGIGERVTRSGFDDGERVTSFGSGDRERVTSSPLTDGERVTSSASVEAERVTPSKVNIIEDNESKEKRSTSLPVGRDVTDARAREDSGGVILSDEERSQLVGKMGEAMTQAYVDHLAEYIARTGKRYPSHFRVISEWYAKDKRDGKLPVVDGAESFDTDEFFEAAVRRQYGDAADQALGVYNG